MATQYDFGAQRIIREARYSSKLFTGKQAQRVAKPKMMSRDVDGQSSHGLVLTCFRERLVVSDEGRGPNA